MGVSVFGGLVQGSWKGGAERAGGRCARWPGTSTACALDRGEVSHQVLMQGWWQVHTIGHTRTGSCICTVKAGVNPECPVRGHSDPVAAVVFSPDGKWFVSGSNDSLVKIWDTETGAEVSSFVEVSRYPPPEFRIV
jgi:WD40 repeat protein